LVPRVFHFAELDSTQNRARNLLVVDEAAPFWVTAGRQTAGRGRLGRTWQSPDGNFYGTLVISAMGLPVHYSFIAGLAVCHAVRAATGNVASLKWPNDVLLDGKKCAGILIEAEGDHLLIGIGVNLFEVPVGAFQYPVTALWPEEKGEGRGERGEIFFAGLQQQMDDWLRAYDTGGFAAIRTAWEAAGPPQGTALTVQTPQQTYQGDYRGLAEDGSLRLTQGAEIIHVHTADVLAG
jgi:BirA family biotin operon repressor/biotin-[acetyl-CoA-carboxylase] ligase